MAKKIIQLLFIVSLVWLIGCGTEQNGTTGEKTASSLIISPTTATVKVNATQVFSATANFTDGTSSPVIATWSVSNNNGSIIAVGYSGIFTGSQVGTCSVTATYQSVSAMASVTVEATTTPSDLYMITISPSSAQGRVSSIHNFNAIAINASGESVEINPTWTMTGEAIGNFSYSGTLATLEALAEGTATITCISSEVSGSATVVINGYSKVITVESDTYVDEANPGTSYEAETTLKAGYQSAVPSAHYETYLRFSLASLPAGAVIENATLDLYTITAGSPSLQLYKLTSSFSAATTWTSRPTSSNFIMSYNFIGGQTNGLSGTDLLALVQGWQATPGDNHGIAIKQDGAENGVAVLTSKEDPARPPTLVIEYDL